jgi:hypothetical protein
LTQEVAYIAYHFHWPRDEIMQLSHLERHGWVKEISRINQEINDSEATTTADVLNQL